GGCLGGLLGGLGLIVGLGRLGGSSLVVRSSGLLRRGRRRLRGSLLRGDLLGGGLLRRSLLRRLGGVRVRAGGRVAGLSRCRLLGSLAGRPLARSSRLVGGLRWGGRLCPCLGGQC